MILARDHPRRVFIGLCEVAGYFGNLRDGLEANGVSCIFVDLSPDTYRYRQRGILAHLGYAIAWTQGRADRGCPGGWLSHLAGSFLRGIRLGVRILLFGYAVTVCDVFIFGAGDSFFHGHELRLLRRLGKRIVWVFTGSDHRPPFLNGRAFRKAEETGELGIRHLAEETRRVRHLVQTVERNADVIIANPASAQFHQRPFVNFLAVGVPFPAPSPIRRLRNGHTVIVHIPSDPESKGTAKIREMIQGIRDQGLAIDYRELIGCPHDEVLESLAAADILVDEVFSDTPMGMLGAEAASVGTPTITGGYYAPWLSTTLPVEAIPPSEYVEPDRMPAVLERYVRDADGRRRLGERAMAFVTNRWAPKDVARNYLRLLSGDTPADWVVEPSTVQYLGGWGMSAETRRRAVQALMGVDGPSALCLDQSPELRDAFAGEAGR